MVFMHVTERVTKGNHSIEIRSALENNNISSLLVLFAIP